MIPGVSASFMATISTAVNKLKGGMDDGPYAPDIAFTTAECTVLYRLLVEFGVALPTDKEVN